MSEFEKLHPKPEHKNGKFISEKFKWKMKREGWLEALKWIDENHRPSGYDGIAILDEIEELEQQNK